MEKQIRWLRVSHWTGAVIDGLAVTETWAAARIPILHIFPLLRYFTSALPLLLHREDQSHFLCVLSNAERTALLSSSPNIEKR